MKVLESTPERYDRGIRILSHGRIDDVYHRLAESVAAPGKRILDLGCGTGGVSLACAALGAAVVGIDRSAGMLEVAKTKPIPTGGEVSWLQSTVAQIEDHFPEAAFDAVVSCLLFSELSPQTRAYALKTSWSRLRPGGEILIADETEPTTALRRLAYQLRRAPRAALAYLLTQTSTGPVSGLADEARAAGFADVVEKRIWHDTFALVHGVKKEASA
jgi:demethylmenaquinone methyltransferase/2-methoxy-6-polyprenyl-1,4-benzoquinol methylase